MKKKRNEKIQIITQVIIPVALCALFIVLLVVIVRLNFDNTMEKVKSNYYKGQMINFCKITEYYEKEKAPQLYPCEKWLLKEAEE